MKFELDVDRRNITNEMLLSDIAAVAAGLGTQSPTTDEYAKHGQFHPSTVIRRFRGWRAALTKAGLTPAHHNGGVDRETALADLRAVAARLGQATVSNKQYVSNGQFTDAPLLRAFGSWNAALKAAELNQAKRAKIPTEELFENLVENVQGLGSIGPGERTLLRAPADSLLANATDATHVLLADGVQRGVWVMSVNAQGANGNMTHRVEILRALNAHQQAVMVEPLTPDQQVMREVILGRQ